MFFPHVNVCVHVYLPNILLVDPIGSACAIKIQGQCSLFASSELVSRTLQRTIILTCPATVGLLKPALSVLDVHEEVR